MDESGRRPLDLHRVVVDVIDGLGRGLDAESIVATALREGGLEVVPSGIEFGRFVVGPLASVLLRDVGRSAAESVEARLAPLLLALVRREEARAQGRDSRPTPQALTPARRKR